MSWNQSSIELGYSSYLASRNNYNCDKYYLSVVLLINLYSGKVILGNAGLK